MYRGSLVLLANTAVLAGLGFVFWTLAARSYPEATVGSFSGLTSGIGLVSAVAGLGLPNVITRHLAGASSPRGLIVVALGAITALGGTLSVILLLGLGSSLPAGLGLRQHGDATIVFAVLVIASALSAAIDAALVVVRATQTVLWTNLAGAVVRIAGLLLLTSLRSSGLVIAYSVGLILATVLSLPPLLAKVGGGAHLGETLALFRGYMAGSICNYMATVLGVLPSTVVVLEALGTVGAARTAPFAAASLVAGFLDVIPSVTSQVLFAEASREGAALGSQLRKALRAIYGLMLPGIGVVVLAAPLVMRVFGPNYAAQGSSCLRILALTSLFTGGTYLVDSVLIARDRTGAYLFMNGANAVLILGCVGFMLQFGITGGAAGWALGQGASLLLGLVVVAAGQGAGAHRRTGERQPAAGAVPGADRADVPRRRMPDLPATRATVPIMLATATGAQQSLRTVSEWMARCTVIERPRQMLAPPGEVVYCGIWFPLLSVPGVVRLVRMTRQPAVLTLVSPYSGLIVADVLPAFLPPDVHWGCMRALRRLGGVPRHMAWATGHADGGWEQFCASVGSEAIPVGEKERRYISEVHSYLERCFLAGMDISSPLQFCDQLMQFRDQLTVWLAVDNARPGPGQEQAPAVLAATDKAAMHPLPHRLAGVGG
jgi:O-antigen/teichoic acid export membrane protein